MTELESMREFFENCSVDDEIVLEEKHDNIYSGDLRDDNPEQDQYAVGPFSQGKYISLEGSVIYLREPTVDGLDSGGVKVTTLVNKTTGEWVGENAELKSRVLPNAE